MIHSVKLTNYRGFTNFSMNELGRINLLVGKNNSGKTSILDGLYFLHSGNWLSLQQQGMSRGWFKFEQNQTQVVQYLDIKNMVINFNSNDELSSIETKNSKDFAKVEFRFDKPNLKTADPNGNPPSQAILNENLILYNFLGVQQAEALGAKGLRIIFANKNGEKAVPLIPLFNGKDIRMDTFNYLGQVSPYERNSNAQIIASRAQNFAAANSAWSGVAFEAAKRQLIVDTLKLMEPKIEGLELLQPSQNSPPGFYFKLRDVNTPVPIGALGDGIRSFLFIILGVISAKDGIIFIDEIDTGIHYSVMDKVWEIISQLSVEVNAQVFATTHSLDCINGLAAMCESSEVSDQDVTIQRIDSNKNQAIPYSKNEIISASKMMEEMR